MGNVKHIFQSAKSDGGDASLVRPSNWNAAHEGAMEILDRDLSQIEVVDDTAETSIYSHSIDANILGATGGIRLTLGGDYLNNSGSTRGLILRVKLGATTALLSNSFNSLVSADRRQWSLMVLFLNSAAAVQKWNASFVMSRAAAATFSIGAAVTDDGRIGAGVADSTEDTTGALVLDVTIDHSVAHASLSLRKELALLELIPAS